MNNQNPHDVFVDDLSKLSDMIGQAPVTDVIAMLDKIQTSLALIASEDTGKAFYTNLRLIRSFVDANNFEPAKGTLSDLRLLIMQELWVKVARPAIASFCTELT